MQRRDVQRLQDIKASIERIRRYSAALDSPKDHPAMTWDAILYNFAVIGEAIKSLSEEVRQSAPDADWAPAAKMRDFVIHQYPAVDMEVVIATVQNDLPQLEEVVDRLLAQQEK